VALHGAQKHRQRDVEKLHTGSKQKSVRQDEIDTFASPARTFRPDNHKQRAKAKPLELL
jgi:hypothetical protein